MYIYIYIYIYQSWLGSHPTSRLFCKAIQSINKCVPAPTVIKLGPGFIQLAKVSQWMRSAKYIYVYVCVCVSVADHIHGETLARWSKPGPSFITLGADMCLCMD